MDTRSGTVDEMVEFQLGEWLVKPASNELVNDHESRRLDQKVMRFLLFLVQHSGEELSRDEILAGVWGDGVHNEEVLTVAVSALRKGLGDDPRKPRFIKTVPRYGYLMLGNSTSLSADRPGNMLQVLEQKIGLRFLIIAALAGFVLLIILVQVIVELVYLLVR